MIQLARHEKLIYIVGSLSKIIYSKEYNYKSMSLHSTEAMIFTTVVHLDSSYRQMPTNRRAKLNNIA
jgi:hypothetical protein